VKVIFDTDIGNDIDDALALGVIHALQSRGECELLAVTITKDNRAAAAFVDAVNTFYGRPDVPIGLVRSGKTPELNKYLAVPAERWPHDVGWRGDVPDAVAVLRQTLESQADHSVTIVQVGFSTNLARLIAREEDRALVKRKVKLLSMMAGSFGTSPHREYNIFIDAPAARKVLSDWPTPIVLSGYEIGEAILFPARSIEKDFHYVAHHPLKEAYELYMPMPYDRPTWDLTSVLYAVRPAREYFDLSGRGEVSVDEKGITHFSPSSKGKCRYLIASAEQREHVKRTLVGLASQRPDRLPRAPVVESITEFQGPYRFLSNFYLAEVEFEGHQYPSVEHAYQAAKFDRDEAMRSRVASASSPAEAKRIAHSATTQRANWDQAKYDVMEQCVRDKFTRHAELREKLMATGDADLIEGNTWGDQIWGVYFGKGDNRLGKILMQVRSELRDKERENDRD
jgi:ribA/ribD-fused uncharacterized protein